MINDLQSTICDSLHGTIVLSQFEKKLRESIGKELAKVMINDLRNYLNSFKSSI